MQSIKRHGFLVAITLFVLCAAATAFPALASTANSIPVQLASSTPIPVLLATTTKEVALTFDDGPYGTSTAQVLHILEKEKVHATFFLVGKNVAKYPALARREVADGDLVGNHSFDHSKTLRQLSASQFEINLLSAEVMIASTTGVLTDRFRPPYGRLSETMRTVLETDGFHIDMWTVDPRDWDYAHSPAKAIVRRVLSKVRPGSILLFHDGRDTHVGYPRDNLIKALPLIIETLKQKGYSFVTVDALVTMTAAESAR